MYAIKVQIYLGLMAKACGPTLLRKLRLEDHRFKTYLSFRVNLGQAWAT